MSTKQKIEEKRQIGAKINTVTKTRFKMACAKIGKNQEDVLEILISDFNKNGLPE